jgi:hypothetical protein
MSHSAFDQVGLGKATQMDNIQGRTSCLASKLDSSIHGFFPSICHILYLLKSHERSLEVIRLKNGRGILVRELYFQAPNAPRQPGEGVVGSRPIVQPTIQTAAKLTPEPLPIQMWKKLCKNSSHKCT